MVNQRIYLDHAATTPVDKTVIEAMQNYMLNNWHNPSSIYIEGQRASNAIQKSREDIANFIGAIPEEIFFTSGGSESNNLAIRGVVESFENENIHIVTSSVEHHAVIDPIEMLSNQKKITFSHVHPNKEGEILADKVLESITKDTKLVSIMHANNEVGAINDIKLITEKIKARNPKIIVHSDSVQYVAHFPIDVKELGVDLLSFTGHKFYGPRGAGVLYIKNGIKIVPQIIGGGQEKNIRAGTENVAAIIGLAKAMEISVQQRKLDINRDQELFEELKNFISREISGIGFTGPKDPNQRIPGMLSLIIDGIEGEAILLGLDMQGICASSGSACSTGSIEPSHVLTAMGIPSDLARGSLRLSFGRANTRNDIQHIKKILPEIITNLRALSSQKNISKKNQSEWLDS
ncbi:MAG: cysteine desulfurase family protein [Dehalococcoidia bacterium]